MCVGRVVPSGSATVSWRGTKTLWLGRSLIRDDALLALTRVQPVDVLHQASRKRVLDHISL